MNLTFKGFLKIYLRELTGGDTLSLRRLSDSVLTSSPSAEEALWCYSAASGSLDRLCRITAGTGVGARYARMTSWYRGEPLGEFLRKAGGRYAKVWQAYLQAKDPEAGMRAAAAALRPKVTALLAERGVTAYDALGRAGINRGNGYAWIRGDDTRLSPKTAARLYASLAGDGGLMSALEGDGHEGVRRGRGSEGTS